MATQKSHTIYCCEKCDYNTSNKKDYNKHLLTAKHTKAIECYTNAIQKVTCSCGKSFTHTSSYYRHKKNCNGDQNKQNIPDANIDPNSIMQIIQQNDEFKTLLIEQNKIIIDQNSKVMDLYKNGVANTTNNTMNNTR